MPRLVGKVATVTGAASGIGKGTAELFAEHGARLVLVDRDGDELAVVRDRLAGMGAEVVTVPGDVARRETIASVVDSAITRFGRIDVVFNNAGIMPSGDLLSFAEESWDEVLAVNLKSMFLMCKAVVPHSSSTGLARSTSSRRVRGSHVASHVWRVSPGHAQ